MRKSTIQTRTNWMHQKYTFVKHAGTSPRKAKRQRHVFLRVPTSEWSWLTKPISFMETMLRAPSLMLDGMHRKLAQGPSNS